MSVAQQHVFKGIKSQFFHPAYQQGEYDGQRRGLMESRGLKAYQTGAGEKKGR